MNWIKITKIFLYITFLIIITEIASYFALKIYLNLRVDLLDTSSVDSDLAKELSFVQKKTIFRPTRWYTNLPDFYGTYVQTDSAGFRINKTTINEKKAIGFFGGSAMFSVITDQVSTIPAYVDIEGFDELNFGIGGYSTTAEIMTLVEATRLYPQISVAVFYDGVNEISRYLEMKDDNYAYPKLYQNIGYPYQHSIKSAIRNNEFSIRISDSNFYYIIKKLLKIKFLKNYSEGKIISMAREIVDIYYNNLSDMNAIAKSKGIQTLFFWQPTIYSSKSENLSSRETQIKNSLKLTKQLSKIVTDMVLNDPRRVKFNVHDLSNSLDKAPSDIFYDWTHINSLGNSIVALEIKKILLLEIK